MTSLLMTFTAIIVSKLYLCTYLIGELKVSRLLCAMSVQALVAPIVFLRSPSSPKLSIFSLRTHISLFGKSKAYTNLFLCF